MRANEILKENQNLPSPGEAMDDDGYVYSGKNLPELTKTLAEYMKKLGYSNEDIARDIKDKDYVWMELYQLPRRMTSPGADNLASAKKLWQYTNKYITDLASMASSYKDRNAPYIEHSLGNLFKTADGQRIKVGFTLKGNISLQNNTLIIPVEFMYYYRGMTD